MRDYQRQALVVPCPRCELASACIRVLRLVTCEPTETSTWLCPNGHEFELCYRLMLEER